MEIFKQPNFDFVGKRKIAYLFSLFFILLGMVSLIVHRGGNWGIDFTGGVLVQLKFPEPIGSAEIRELLSAEGIARPFIQEVPHDNVVIIRVKEKGLNPDLIAEKLKRIFATHLLQNIPVIERSELVGPVVGTYLIKAALKAFSFVFLGIIIYVAIRFKGTIWGIAAVVALLHDTFIVFGFLSLLNKEITLVVVAAILFLIGYSVNDTIVIFDRIRERLKMRLKENLAQVLNQGVNATLSRTLITSVTTLFVALALFIFGGAVIHDFAFVLGWGVIVGTYSSIFIASPLVYEWYKKFERSPAGQKKR